MLNLEFERVQRAVGQGGFHTGSIGLCLPGAETFNYVYDCGAMPTYAAQRRREIANYVDELGGPGSQLDVLFLSHAHADHINGVPDLLSKMKGLQVDTIVLPLSTIAERLMAFAAGVAVDLRMGRDPFHRRFVLDPIAALSTFGPRQILVVRPGDGGAPGSGTTPLDGRPRGGEGVRIGVGTTGQVLTSLMGRGRIDGPVGPTTGQAATATIDDTIAMAVRTSDSSLHWLLAPYVDPGVRKGRARFLAELKRQTKFRWSPRSFEADVETLLNDVTLHRSLRKAYAKLGHDLNLTSLCLYSGPAEHGHEAYAYSEGRNRPCYLWRRPAWLAAGDTTLKNPAVAQSLLDHYGKHCVAVGTLMLPHHGSEHNFSAARLAELAPDLCIVAADAYNKWRHPGTLVVQAVASLGIPLSVVTAAEQSRVTEHGGSLR